jgi:hypothetical protein
MIEQKIEAFWRDATAADIARVMKGDKVEARFRDDTCDKWKVAMLGGYGAMSEGFNWIDIDGDCWTQCQVYDPQQWWLDKPDPGEGYRLLKKFPDEPLQIGDEGQLTNGEWGDSFQARIGGKQALEIWYRRRIEPVNSPEKLDSSRSKDNIPIGWRLLNDNEDRIASDAYWSQGASEWCLIGKDRVEYANRDKWPVIRLSAECAQPEPQTDTAKTSNSSAAAQPANLPALKLGDAVMLPNGQTIRITESGFEVF